MCKHGGGRVMMWTTANHSSIYLSIYLFLYATFYQSIHPSNHSSFHLSSPVQSSPSPSAVLAKPYNDFGTVMVNGTVVRNHVLNPKVHIIVYDNKKKKLQTKVISSLIVKLGAVS